MITYVYWFAVLAVAVITLGVLGFRMQRWKPAAGLTAAVLLAGIHRIPWRRFWPPVLLSNLGVALAYSLFGHVAEKLREELPHCGLRPLRLARIRDTDELSAGGDHPLGHLILSLDPPSRSLEIRAPIPNGDHDREVAIIDRHPTLGELLRLGHRPGG